MVCRKVERLLMKFVEGELSGKVKEEVARHLDICSNCRKERDLILESWQMLDNYNAPKVREDFTSSLMRRIHSEQSEIIRVKYPFPRFILRRLVPVFASVIVAVLVWSLFWKKPETTKIAEVAPLEPEKAVTQIAGNQVIQEEPGQEIKVAVARPSEPEKAATRTADNRIIQEAPKEIEVAIVRPVEPIKVTASADDLEIIRNLDVLQNVELLQNMNVVKELDVIENLDSGVS